MPVTRTELLDIARDRQLQSPELYKPNDYYGHATILKRYANLPPCYTLKCSIEHGPSIDNIIWDNDLNAPLPGMLIFAPRRLPQLRGRTNRALFAIGPLMQYAEPDLTEERLAAERKRLGRNLLVFPGHSTHWADSQYDLDGFCKKIAAIARDFDSVRICLGWKEVLRGQMELFEKHGFECVTAGHMFDPWFHSRLKTIIMLAHTAYTNDPGSHVGYCVLFDKPVWVEPVEIEWKTDIAELKKFYAQHKGASTHSRANVIRLFAGRPGAVTGEQRAFVNHFWGAATRRTPEELRTILEILEDMYAKKSAFFLFHQHLMPAQAVEYLNTGENRKALALLDDTVPVHPLLPTLHYGRAMVLGRLGRSAEAAEALKLVLEHDAAHEGARALLETIDAGAGPGSRPSADAGKPALNLSDLLGAIAPPDELTMLGILTDPARTDETTLPVLSMATHTALLKLWEMRPFDAGLAALISRLPPPKPDAPLPQSRASSAPVDAAKLNDARAFLQEAITALKADDARKAFDALNKAKALKQPQPGIDYTRAMIFLQAKDAYSAREAVLEELRYFPDNAPAAELLTTINAQLATFNTTSLGDAAFQEIYAAIRPYTMLSPQRLHSIYALTKKICLDNIPGNFVECGVAAGGSTALMASVIKRFSKQPRLLYSFDSFEGMPEPTARDRHQGVTANSSGWGAGTCAAPIESVKEICARLGVTEVVSPVKGYFEQTLPAWRNAVGMISFLHLDGDWYQSTKTILENLYDRIVNDGVLQADDYGHWEGCREAIHEFEHQRGLHFTISKIDGTGVWFPRPDRFARNPAIPAALEDIFTRIDPVRLGIISQMSCNERFQLFYAAHALLPADQPIRTVEIGSFSGASLMLLFLTLKSRGLGFDGFCVEPGGTQQFYVVIEKVKPEIRHLKMFSHDALKHLHAAIEADGIRPRFIFVDGDHTYEGVRRDIAEYYPLLAPGGIMLFHDYLPPLDRTNRQFILAHHANTEPGIRRACQEMMDLHFAAEPIELPLLYPDDPTQTQPHLPIIPGVFSTIRAYRKPLSAKE
jgi:tetratricopeptide (TPR) repeat protein/predicted O-methyltransferase YrrM